MNRKSISLVSIDAMNELKSVTNEVLIKLKTTIYSDIKYDDIANVPLLIVELVDENCRNKNIHGKDKLHLAKTILDEYLTNISKHTDEEKESIRVIFVELVETYLGVAKRKIDITSLGKKKAENNTILVSENLYNKFISFVTNDEEEPSLLVRNFMSYVVFLIQQVNEYKDLQGLDKKKIVLNVLTKFSDEVEKHYKLTEKQKQSLQYAVSLLPTIIDTLFYVHKKYSKLTENKKSCFPWKK